MPSDALNFTSGIAAPVTLVADAETVIATVKGVDVTTDGKRVELRASTLLTSDATTTGVLLWLREGSLTGTVVAGGDTQDVITAAGSTNVYGIAGADAPGDGTGFTYVLTASCVAATVSPATVWAVLDAVVF